MITRRPSSFVNRAQLAAWWLRMAPRERLAIGAAAGVVGLGLLWGVLLGPALATLRAAETQHMRLDTQLQHMGALKTQAQAMQSQPRQNPDEALRQLESSVKQHLGPNARLAVSGDRATVTLSAVPPELLAQWLAQARVMARAVPSEARLSRNAAGLWDGTLVLALPPR